MKMEGSEGGMSGDSHMIKPSSLIILPDPTLHAKDICTSHMTIYQLWIWSHDCMYVLHLQTQQIVFLQEVGNWKRTRKGQQQLII